MVDEALAEHVVGPRDAPAAVLAHLQRPQPFLVIVSRLISNCMKVDWALTKCNRAGNPLQFSN